MDAFRQRPSSLNRKNMSISGSKKSVPKPVQASVCSQRRSCMKIPLKLVDIYNGSTCLQSFMKWSISVLSSLSLLSVVPLCYYTPQSVFDSKSKLLLLVREIWVGWGPLLAVSPWVIVLISSIAGFHLARQCHMGKLRLPAQKNNTARDTIVSFTFEDNAVNSSRSNVTMHLYKTIEILKHPKQRKLVYVVGMAVMLAIAVTIQSNLQMMHPSWIWNPLLWGYNVYWPSTIASSIEGLCVDKELSTEGRQNSNSKWVYGYGKRDEEDNTLCLPEKSWRSLSTDTLSSSNQNDIKTVIDGLRYLKEESGGIILSVMSRDTIDAITPLRLNVEGMLPFTSNLAVVVFENDSSDGTREAFLEWSEEVKGRYDVDVIECKEAPGCKFRESHRDFEKDIPYDKTSAIGRMGEFRQRMVDYILEESKYSNFTHFIVLDIDLSVSISPLGIIHTIGKLPHEAVASSGRQPRPGSFGSLQPPYDFSAFVPYETNKNERMIHLNKKFCSLKPEGYRWRNECTAVSVSHFMMIQSGDKLNYGEPYLVDSAFNGAVVYPIKLVRESQAKYDSGSDGQRCEHIGFNLSLKRPMYINPKWDMHLDPHVMGGPSGKRAMRTISGIAKSPVIAPIIFFQSMFSLMIFIYCIMTLTMKIVYPLWVYIVRVTIGDSKIFSLNERNVASTSSLEEMEYLMTLENGPRKRKVSEFEIESGSNDIMT
mmetsp:Transcript_15165/g.18466  ORF Transcript_15165/g.18466 Transcript_15165/m.18466 type:complete len:707 (+) Transcript_15165:418-2538(+)